MDEVAFLEELLSIPSISGEEDAIVDHLVACMGRFGFSAHRDAAGNAVGELGVPTASRRIILLGHVDTVPGRIPVRRTGSRLYGRGAVDAKGPLAAFILAAVRARERLNDVLITVIGAVEEESQSRGAHYLAETVPAPDAVIIGEPGGWQGITLGYKGTMSIDYHLSRSAGHGAGNREPPAEAAVAFWNQVVELARDQNGDRRPPNFGTLDPTLRSIQTQGDGLQESVTMRVGLRLPPGSDIAEFERRLLGFAGDAVVTVPYVEPPFRAAKNTPVVRALLRAVRHAGGKPRFKLKTGTSDMNVVGPVWRCPIVAYGPGDASLDHTPNEHIVIDEFLRGICVLEEALRLL